LLPCAHDAVKTYSHGMRQRLGIAQALLPRPEFVILDEPTDGLDPQGIREIRMLLPQLRDELGLTIMLSSHLLYEVERICNVVAIINEGRLVYQGAIDGLVNEERLVRIKAEPLEDAYRLLVGTPELSVQPNGSNSIYVRMREERIASVNASLVQHQIRISELSVQRATLEEVFLKLTVEKSHQTNHSA
jgi:ABC-type multidrug transport system ATPase subunit